MAKDTVGQGKQISLTDISLRNNISELKSTFEGFAESLDPEEVYKAVDNVSVRAQVCVSQNGGQFQHRLHKH